MKTMRYLGVLAAVGMLLAVTGTAGAVPVWKEVPFDSTLGGAVSYDASGDNVVVAGRAFYTAITALDSPLGTQLVHGDGIDLEVAGNFAMYGVLTYTDSANILAWAMANANTLLAIEVRAQGVKLDFNGDGTADYTEGFTLNAKDMPGVDYLKATFADLAQEGYTELAHDVWMDIALDPVGHPGLAAMSIVINGYSNDTWNSAFANGFDAIILPGNLNGPTNMSPGSGIRIAPIPEPLTMAGLALGIGSLATYLRRRRAA